MIQSPYLLSEFQKSKLNNVFDRLSAADNFLGDYALVEDLETTYSTAIEIKEKVKEVKINEARELYQHQVPVSARSTPCTSSHSRSQGQYVCLCFKVNQW